MRVVVFGIGNKERGDDAFGPYIVDQVRESEWIKKIDCGMHPENYVQKAIDGVPELVIIFDTVAGSQSEPVLLKDDEIVEMSPVSVSTHNLSLGAMYELMRESGVASVFFFGVPAVSYTHLSSQVKNTADRVISVLNDIDKTRRFSIMSLYDALSEQLR
ncbi:MAG: hydrogenase maturation protease [candidate division WOR-3 bacterium]